MAHAIKFKAIGLRCDHNGCGWSDMTIPRAEYPRYRNASCPRCGSNVLTDADWRTLRRLEFWVDIINAVFFWLPEQPEDVPHYAVRMGTDGTGALAVKHVEHVDSAAGQK